MLENVSGFFTDKDEIFKKTSNTIEEKKRFLFQMLDVISLFF